jgi:hypothetical protein|tara:strand:- start:178 stop:924 length:747 start_codon:yes stop_codon:yes gene_type:complete
MADKNKLVFFIFDYTKALAIARVAKTLAFGFYIPKAKKFILADEILPSNFSSQDITKKMLEKTFKDIIKNLTKGYYFLDYPGGEGYILTEDLMTGEPIHSSFNKNAEKPAYEICCEECFKTQKQIFVIANNKETLMHSLFKIFPQKTIDVMEGMTFLACIPIEDIRLMNFLKKYLPLLDEITELRKKLAKKEEKAGKTMKLLSNLLPITDSPLLTHEDLPEGKEETKVITREKVPPPSQSLRKKWRNQ